MAKTKLIIELGSSNTVIYKVGNGLVLRESSVVAIKNGKDEVFEVGIKAKKMQGKTDESISVIEPIVSGEIANEKYATIMLKAFLTKISVNKLVDRVEVTFCVSAGLNDNQLLLFKNVAYSCGLSKVKFVNVCLSGLIGAGVSVEKSTAVACVNLGGGTCNFAVISLGKVIEGFSVTFGGIDMDKAIVDYVKNVKNMEISMSVAEKIKNECGSLYMQDTTNMEILGVDSDTKKPIGEIITANEVRDAIINFFDNIKSAIEHLLYGCSADIISDISLSGIYVIGGIANITGLENFLAKKLNMPVFIPEEPENCSILGACNL